MQSLTQAPVQTQTQTQTSALGQSAPGGALLGYHFYLMQAHVVPGGGYSGVRKRLIRSVSCAHEAKILAAAHSEGTLAT